VAEPYTKAMLISGEERSDVVALCGEEIERAVCSSVKDGFTQRY